MIQFNIVAPINKVPSTFKLFLQSIENQDYREKKLFVIIDNNPQLKNELLEHFHDINFDYIILENNGTSGPSATRNLAINYINDGFITFLDSDDMLGKNYLKKMSNFLEKNPNVKAVAASGKKYALDDKQNPLFRGKSNLIFKSGCLDHMQVFLNEIGSISGFTISSKNKVLFDESMFFLEDYDFYLKNIADGIQIFSNDKAEYYYFIGSGPKKYDKKKQRDACNKINENNKRISNNFFHNLLLYLQSNKLRLRHSNYKLEASIVMLFIFLIAPSHSFRFLRRLLSV
ncbi:MAG: glycosyltransferase [Gammaproteobacteria bacterium]